MKIYLAHPISGQSAEQVIGYYTSTIALLEAMNYDVLCPMTGKGYLRTEKKFKSQGYNNPVSTNHAIKERDQWMIGLADVVLIDLLGAKDVSIGCVMELAWGDMARKHTVVIMEADNPHRHAFVLECADIVFENYQDAAHYLHDLIRGDM